VRGKAGLQIFEKEKQKKEIFLEKTQKHFLFLHELYNLD